MTLKVATVLLSLLLGAGQAAAAAPPAQTAAAQPVSPAKREAALNLARLYMPVDTLIDAELAAFDAQFAVQIVKNQTQLA